MQAATLVVFAAATGAGIVAADFPVFANVGSAGLLALPVEMLEQVVYGRSD